jgi:hypothetical protein
VIQRVRAQLLPVLVMQGFEAAPLVNQDPVDRESVLSFPAWGRLTRSRETGVDLIEIQFASHGRAAFRVNSGVAPRDGVATLMGHVPAEGVSVHWLSEYFETHARPWLRPILRALGLEPLGGWFSVWHWPFQSPTQHEYAELVSRVASFVPELDLALREGRLGPHMRKVVIPRSNRRIHKRST